MKKTTDAETTANGQLSRAELNDLLSLLDGGKEPARIEKELNAAIQKYRQEKGSVIRSSSPQTDDAGLREVSRLASDLSDALGRLKKEEFTRLAAAASIQRPAFGQALEEMAPRLGDIADAADKAIKNAQDEMKRANGESEQAPVKELILALMTIFERETGKEAGNSWHPIENVYFGPFFDFVKGVLDIVAPHEASSNKSLGSRITRALMAARELSGSYLARTHGQGPRVRMTR